VLPLVSARLRGGGDESSTWLTAKVIRQSLLGLVIFAMFKRYHFGGEGQS
jgi:hypothetical protein